MKRTLDAIASHRKLDLQLVATGMHLDPAHGEGVRSLEHDGWRVDRTIPWPASSGRDRTTTARNTGHAIAHLADTFADLQSDIVLIVGDRVEAFAAASAAHLCGVAVAHVHGGDRAAGQVDDSLRHAITKLAHLHFPATKQSASRIKKLGEDPSRIHLVGSPGIDGIVADASSSNDVRAHVGELTPRKFALLVLHPADADDALEERRARMVLKAALSIGYERVVIIYPNNDPGSAGILRVWDAVSDPRVIAKRDVPRPIFLGLIRDAAVLLGNSSSGIIEAASFGTPVVDIGPRQQGRERSRNVSNVPYKPASLRRELLRLWNAGKPKRFAAANMYGGQGTGRRIAQVLATTPLNDRLLRKLISY